MSQQHTPAATSEEEAEAPMHGNILETILSHVPLIHLLSASHVSTSWNDAVSSSLTLLNPIKPFLLLHSPSSPSPSIHVYDPRSHTWLHLHRPTKSPSPSTLRSSHSSISYSLSPTTFSFSLDPLTLTWHHVSAPRVWRVDPVVARVGHHVVVAGGSCDFEDNPLSVEIYDMKNKSWRVGPTMPDILKGSSANTWLSVAVHDGKMLLTEKSSGVTYTFDPYDDTWRGPYDLKPDGSVYCCVVGVVRRGIIVMGLDLEGVRLWEVRGKMGNNENMVEIGEVPREMVDRLKGESDGCVGSIGMSVSGDTVYVYNNNTWEMSDVVVGEINNNNNVVGGILCEWKSVTNVVMKWENPLQRVVIGCGDVGLEDLQKAVNNGWRLSEVKAQV